MAKNFEHGKVCGVPYEIKKDEDHYTLYVNGDFYSTGESIREIHEELKDIEDNGLF